MRSLIIHMSSSTARRENADRLLRDLPNAELIEAVNGRDPDQISGVGIHPGTLHRPRYPFALRPAEIGVFQSHRKCWQYILDSGEAFMLIAEDDLTVDPARLQRALRLVADHATPDMYIRLPVKAREKPGVVIANDAEMRFILPKNIALQCVAQVVGRNAARRLLAATDEIDRPVDTFLQMHWASGQPVHAILPTGNREVAQDIGGSTIQSKTPPGSKLSREWNRAVYRAKVAMRPQRE